MTGISLTKKSKEQIYQQNNATGIVFIKTDKKEITSFEFYRGRNGQFYLTDARKPLKVSTELEWLSNQIPEEE